MKRTLTILCALTLLCVSGPALAQDDWDDDEIGADEFGDDAFGDDESSSSSDQGQPLGMAPAELGIGFRRTLSGNLGPEVEYWLSDKILITGGLTLAFIDPPGDATDSQTFFVLSGGGFYNLVSGDRAALLGGARLVLALNTAGGFDEVTMESESLFQVNIELPLRTEVFLTKLFSLHFETGVAIAFIPEDGAVLASAAGFGAIPDSTSVAIGGTAGLFGAAGITIYWP